MIDYFFQFSNEAAAISDASGTLYYKSAIAGAPAHWNYDNVIPGIQVWRPSQDTVDGNGNVTHTFLTGWYGVISLNHVDNTLLNHAKLQVAIDRDKANAGVAGMVLKNNLTPSTLINDLMFSPVFDGANYPWGNFV